MKTFKILFSLMTLVLIALVAMSFSNPGTLTKLAALPDLRVSAIATPGGLCKGNESKVRVSITNSQSVGVSADVPVILFVSQSGEQPSSYVGYLKGGIGPNANSGQPVWFNNVVIPATNKTVTLKALVNPDGDIEESVQNNNTKVISAKVTKACGQATQPAQGATLTVTAYVGPWNNSNYTGLPQAAVTIVKSGQTYTGTTGSNGKATFPNLPAGQCNITVVKQGFQNGTKVFNMSTYNNNTNVAMAPN
ncbi:MAG: carboxypeptidase regulatory-like domain-containing protein [Saprospiraceae bacterium]|nr:carboxypeptidase regulatory-like domain-containing protein [Saprospiraceae bacterium]